MTNPYLIRVLYFALGVVVGSMLSCGSDGSVGPAGPRGTPGTSLQGPAGTDGTDAVSQVGPVGPTGLAGSSCHVEQLDNGARIFCDDGSEAIVQNGHDGQDCQHHHGRKPR